MAEYYFDDFRVDLLNRQLLKGDDILPLNSKYFDILVLLIEQAGKLATKEFIFDQVWGDVVVSDSALSQGIKEIRRYLKDNAASPRYIKTIPKHGFMFIGNIGLDPVAEEKGDEPEKSFSGIKPRPYKFLDYYTENDSNLFFGREAESDTICSRILGHRTLILYGRSGAGKSSIVRAGLIPRLKKEGHLAFVIRSYTDPIREFSEVISRATQFELPQPQAEFFVDGIKKVLSQMGSKKIILFFDQFEDFFLLLPQEKKDLFYRMIDQLLADEAIPLKIVFVVREDLFAEMSRFKQIIPEIFHHEFRLARLSFEQAARAIIGPAQLVGCPVQEQLIKRLLNDIGEHGVVDPPQMQIVCDILYDVSDNRSGLTVENYEKLGGASKILTNYLEQVMARFGSADLRRAKFILTLLISSAGQRLVLKFDDLMSRIQGIELLDPELVKNLVEDLASARIIRFSKQDGARWIELAHDFLIPEVSKWISDEETALKKARAVLERGMENYRAHQLLLSTDTLEILLPLCKKLGVSEEEADLIAHSLLQQKGPVPGWLIKRSTNIPAIIQEAANDPDSSIRLRAVESFRNINGSSSRVKLKHLALWDKDVFVRKAASILMMEKYGRKGQQAIALKNKKEKVGLIRRAISLAFARDTDKKLVKLWHLKMPLILLVTFGLMWVRLRRGGNDIFRQVSAGIAGSGFSGLVVGLLLGVMLALGRHGDSFETTSTILVLMSLGTIAGSLGGLGISFGIVAVGNISYRHSHWWSVGGGALGGLIVSGSLNILGVDILKALFGQDLIGITGAFEGLMIGLGVALGSAIASQLSDHRYALPKIIGAAIGSMIAAIVLTMIQGNLFSGSIELIARSFANSRIRLEPLASFFGEQNFGRISHIVLGAAEGFLFGGFMVGAMEFIKKHDRNRNKYLTKSGPEDYSLK